MSFNRDAEGEELRRWRASWRESPAAPNRDRRAAVRAEVGRRTWVMAGYTGLEMLVGAAMLVFLAFLARRLRTPIDQAVLSTFALMTIAANAFSLWNRRGTWRPATETARAFLDLSVLRLERQLRSLRAGGWLLAAEAALLAPWMAYILRQRAAQSGTGLTGAAFLLPYAALLLWCGLFAGALVLLARRARRQLARLRALQEGLEETF